MNWVDVAWPAMAGASLTLGLIHVLMWFRRRHEPALLMFGLVAGTAAVLAIFELLMMRAQTPLQYFTLLRWVHIPVSLLTIALVGFVLLRFRTGRPWLGITACALRVVATIPSFFAGGSLRFRNVAELASVQIWGGGSIAVPVGSPSPFGLVAGLGDLLLACFLADAIVTARKRGQDPVEQRRVTLVCGSMFVFVVLSAGMTNMVGWGGLRAPLTVIAPFMVVLIVMGIELGGSAVSAGALEQRLGLSELQLRESEQRFRFTAEAVDVGLWTWDFDSRGSWLTQTGSNLLGLPAGERVGADDFLVNLHPDAREVIQRAYDEATRHTGKFECQFPMTRPDGGNRWISARGRVEYDDAETPIRMRGVVLDVTERRRAEERFRLAVESSPNALLMIDGDGRIVLANAQAERLFGYSAADLLDMRIDVLVPSLAASATSHSGQDRFQATAAASGVAGLRRDGSEVPIEMTLNPIEMAGDLRFALASITDISGRLRVERELAAQRDELAHLSRVALLGEMSSSLAHELNQPLTAILSNAQAALRFLDRDTPELGEVREALVQVVQNDKRAGDVIQRLRAMLRKERIDYRNVSINEVVEDVLRLGRSDLLIRNVAVVKNLARNLPDVRGDPVQLQQVVLNLVKNACDAMDGVVRDRQLQLRTGTTADGMVELSVSDVGCGIPEADLDRIFDPYFTTKTDGMGLGLSICFTIIKSHDGSMWATSNPAGGTTLHVLVPPCTGAFDDPDVEGTA